MNAASRWHTAREGDIGEQSEVITASLDHKCWRIAGICLTVEEEAKRRRYAIDHDEQSRGPISDVRSNVHSVLALMYQRLNSKHEGYTLRLSSIVGEWNWLTLGGIQT